MIGRLLGVFEILRDVVITLFQPVMAGTAMLDENLRNIIFVGRGNGGGFAYIRLSG